MAVPPATKPPSRVWRCIACCCGPTGQACANLLTAVVLLLAVSGAWVSPSGKLSPSFESVTLSLYLMLLALGLAAAECAASGYCGLGALRGLGDLCGCLQTGAGRASLLVLAASLAAALSRCGSLGSGQLALSTGGASLLLFGTGVALLDAVFNAAVALRLRFTSPSPGADTDAAAASGSSKAGGDQEALAAAAVVSFLAARPELALRVLGASAAGSPAGDAAGALLYTTPGTTATTSNVRAARVALALANGGNGNGGDGAESGEAKAGGAQQSASRTSPVPVLNPFNLFRSGAAATAASVPAPVPTSAPALPPAATVAAAAPAAAPNPFAAAAGAQQQGGEQQTAVTASASASGPGPGRSSRFLSYAAGENPFS